jgi:exodeoxyribonuclease V alpha subunit
LTEIKRQNIGALVTNIKQMNYDIITNDDFYDDTIKLINIEDFTIDNKIINKDAILNIINENNLNKENSIFISYFNSDKFVFNTGDLNNIIQNLYNKNDDNLYIKSNNKYNNKFVFKVGDIILRTENDYSSEIMRANGDQAVICDFNKDEVIIKYKGINDKSEKITVDDLYDSFTLAYCITVHKSQGSQYNNVVIFIDKNQTIWDKTALYTAISRSQDRCFIITTPKDFIKIQMNNNKINDKISLLLKESDNYDL